MTHFPDATQRAHSTPEPDIVPPPEGDPLTPPPEKLPDVDPVPIEEPTPPQPPVKMGAAARRQLFVHAI